MVAKPSSGDNRRKDIRSKVSAKVRLMHPSLSEVLLTTYDISDGGIFLYTKELIPPALGELVQVQMTGLPMEAPIITMKIVRRIPKGIGLKFALESDL